MEHGLDCTFVRTIDDALPVKIFLSKSVCRVAIFFSFYFINNTLCLCFSGSFGLPPSFPLFCFFASSGAAGCTRCPTRQPPSARTCDRRVACCSCTVARSPAPSLVARVHPLHPPAARPRRLARVDTSCTSEDTPTNAHASDTYPRSPVPALSLSPPCCRPPWVVPASRPLALLARVRRSPAPLRHQRRRRHPPRRRRRPPPARSRSRRRCRRPSCRRRRRRLVTRCRRRLRRTSRWPRATCRSTATSA